MFQIKAKREPCLETSKPCYPDNRLNALVIKRRTALATLACFGNAILRLQKMSGLYRNRENFVETRHWLSFLNRNNGACMVCTRCFEFLSLQRTCLMWFLHKIK